MSAVLPTPVADVEPHDPNGGRGPIPPDLKAELRRLLKEILVADYRADHIERAIDTPERTEAR